MVWRARGHMSRTNDWDERGPRFPVHDPAQHNLQFHSARQAPAAGWFSWRARRDSNSRPTGSKIDCSRYTGVHAVLFRSTHSFGLSKEVHSVTNFPFWWLSLWLSKKPVDQRFILGYKGRVGSSLRPSAEFSSSHLDFKFPR
jgi:hypothetical protein